ncbi:hypothetical protein Igag_0585 [Ignisphaera aggregans DSM 17230]|uniref:Uncharacterized protein n=1 Tax=Ignisphaera aggregans (strain DSM 17230 / JCM 13409 / AQ1.S1) TaxID=583356 RepID=E0SSE7_IGNAA|nr:hypothetical protein Igag_0585 [Ignisphaera aggregans DSM 17230]
MKLYKALRIVEMALDRSIHMIDVVTDMVKSFICRVHRFVVDRLGYMELDMIVREISRYGEGVLEPRYIDVYSVIEKLKGLGFMELYVEDLGIGFEMEMYSYELNRYVDIVWRCKASRCNLVVSWRTIALYS